MRNHIHVTLKKSPCHVLGLCECQAHTDQLLREPPEGPRAPRNAPAVAGDASDTLAVAGAFEDRPEFAYLTTRGAEEKSNLIALRAEPGNRLENLLWLREECGQYTQKRNSGKAKVRAWNRFLIARVHLRRGVGFMGHSHVVMNVHAHFMVAKGAKGLGTTKLNDYFDRLYEFIERCRVDVLMGDLNMALFALVPALRSRGLTIDTAAWYPWKSAKIGSAMADSCAIFMINCAGKYRLCQTLHDLYDGCPTGILAKFDGSAGAAASGSSSSAAPPAQSIAVAVEDGELVKDFILQ